jgi:hypothetical protein
MITALQNLISGKLGKVLFSLLLLIIVVSFVLYLSQGSSVFDLFPDESRNRQAYYDRDLNNPDVYGTLEVSHRVASDLGAIIVPSAKVMDEAESRFYPEIPQQNQRALMSRYMEMQGRLGELPEEFRQQLQQSLSSEFQRINYVMNNWAYLPRAQKARLIAEQNAADRDFAEGSFKAKVALEHLADQWGLLPPDAQGSDVNNAYFRFLAKIDPRLLDDANRSRAFEVVSRNRGVRKSAVEGILYSYFRASKVEETLSAAGFAFRDEARWDMFGEELSWDIDGLTLSSDDLDVSVPPFATLNLKGQPKPKDRLTLRSGGKVLDVEFRVKHIDSNSTLTEVLLGAAGNLTATRDNLLAAIKKSELGFVVEGDGNASLAFTLDEDQLPSAIPSITTPSSALVVSSDFSLLLQAFHEERKEDPLFQEPVRTIATAVTFAMNDYMPPTSEPTEDRLRRYFESNKAEFQPLPPPPPAPVLKEGNATNGQPGPDGKAGPKGEANATAESNASVVADINLNSISADINATGNLFAESNASFALLDANATFLAPEVTFEEVRPEVLQRVKEENRLDAEREAMEIARENAIEFLDELNQKGNRLKNKYRAYPQLRQSPEVTQLIKEKGSSSRSISFTEKEMALQSHVLGLEKRASENRSGKQPLEEVAALNERRFFTPSVRKARDGYVVFILDGHSEAGPGKYENASFSTLYREYRKDARAKAFSKAADKLTTALESDDASAAAALSKKARIVSLKAKNSQSVSASYDGRSRRSDAKQGKLEGERENIVKKETGDENATAVDTARKKEIDLLLENLREERGELNAERSLAQQVVDKALDLEIGTGWKELERTEKLVTFARLKRAYVKKLEHSDASLDERLEDLQSARAEEARDRIIGDLIVAGSEE